MKGLSLNTIFLKRSDTHMKITSLHGNHPLLIDPIAILPQEVMIKVFHYLPRASLASSSLVSHAWHQIVSDPSIIREFFFRVFPKSACFYERGKFTFSLLRETEALHRRIRGDYFNPEKKEILEETSVITGLKLLDSNSIAAATMKDGDCSLKIWDLSEEKLKYCLNTNSRIHSFKINETHVFINYRRGLIQKWDYHLEELNSEKEFVNWSPDAFELSSNKLYLGFSDGSIKVLNTELEEVDRFKSHRGGITWLSTYDEYLFSADSSYNLFVWDRETKKLLQQFPDCYLPSSMECAFNSLLVGTCNGQLISYDLRDNKEKTRFKSHTDVITSIYGFDYEIIVSSFEPKIRFWDLRRFGTNDQEFKELAVGNTNVYSLDGNASNLFLGTGRGLFSYSFLSE